MAGATRWHARPLVGGSVSSLATDVYQQLRDLDQALRTQIVPLGMPAGTTNQTLRHNGTDWIANSTVTITGSGAAVTGTLSVTGAIIMVPDNTYDIGASGATRPRTGYFATSVVTPLSYSPVGAAYGFGVNGADWQVDTSGHLVAPSDNVRDIGASGATRPRSGYFGTSLVVATDPGTTGGGILRVGGGIKSALGTITTDTRGLWSTATWNNSATTFVHAYLDVTASLYSGTDYLAGSKILDIRHSNVSRFEIRLAAQGGSDPLVKVTPPADRPGLGVYSSHSATYATESVLIQPTLNTSGSPSLVHVNAVNGGGYGAVTQLLRASLGGATQFSVLVDGSTGIGGGADTNVICRVGVGAGNTTAFDGLKVDPTLVASTTAHNVVRVIGAGRAGTYTNNVHSILVGGPYLKAAGQTITTWYGIKVEAGPTAGTKWSGHFAEDVNVGGDLYVGGSLIGGGGATTLNDLTDVTITTPATGHFLRYNGSLWVNQLGVAEADVVDGSLLARLAATETVAGAWTFTNSAGLTLTDTGLRRRADGVLYIQSDTASTISSLELIPKGSPNPPAQLSLWKTDFIADAVNYERIIFRASTTGYAITQDIAGTGSYRGMTIAMNPATQNVGFNTDGTTVFGTNPGGSQLLRLTGSIYAVHTDAIANVFSFSGQDGSWTNTVIERFANSGGLNMAFWMRGGTVSSPTQAWNGYTAGLDFGAQDDASGIQSVGAIYASLTAAPTSTSSPGKLRFYTTPAGSVSPTERMYINSDGSVIIGTDPTGSEILRVGGTLRASAIGVGAASLADRSAYIAHSNASDAYSYGTTSFALQTGATTGGLGPVGGYFRADVNAPALTVSASYGAFIAAPVITAGTLTTAYGLYINPITGAGTNYAIYANGGWTQLNGPVGILTPPVADRAFNIAPSAGALTGTFQYGATIQPEFSSGATTEVRSLNLRVLTEAAAYTVAQASALYILNPSKGAGSAITTSYGVRIESQTQGGTNYAIYTDTGLVRIGDQLQSAVTTGTAPFIIASTTLVTNLNADLLDGNEASAFAAASHVHDASAITTSTFADARIAQSNVTQHQAALTIAESQITDGSILARVAGTESITGSWTFAPSGTTTAIAVTQAVGAKGVVITGGTQTANQPALNITQTWNNGAVTFKGLSLNVTNTASASDSLLVDIQSTGASALQVAVNKQTAVWPGGGITTPGLAFIGDLNTGLYNSAADTITFIVGGQDYLVLNTTKLESKRNLDLTGATKLLVSGTQVVGARVTGYTAMTGSADRATSYATSTITLQQLAERVKALQDDLTTHGLIGA